MASMRFDLPSEDLVGAVIVCDRGQRRRFGMQRDRRKRAPFAVEAADEFCGEVLRLCRAAAVAGREQPAATAEGFGAARTPCIDRVERVAKRCKGRTEFGKV